MNNVKKVALVIAGIGLLVSGEYASAGSATNTMSTSATVVANCSIASGTTIAFGNFDPTAGTVDDQSANFTVTCTNGAAVNLGLDGGGAGAANVSSRVMSDGGVNTLAYTLSSGNYASNSGTNWGNTDGTDTVAITGTGTAQSTTIYGEIPVQTTAHTGSYTDTVNMYAYF